MSITFLAASTKIRQGIPSRRHPRLKLVRHFRKSESSPVRILMILLLAMAVAVQAETLPDRRPVLVGSGPDSLINLVDPGELMRKGQRDAWVMFDCVIGADGRAGKVISYRVSPEAELLKREVSRKLKRSKFIPAVYNHRATSAGLSGTVIFVIKNGRPHLRIYENQDMEELRRGSDFIAPQVVAMPNTSYPGHAGYLGASGVVRLRHSVDANGETTQVDVLWESPPGEDFAESAKRIVRRSEYLPAYRNGRPVASVTTFDFRFLGRHYLER